FRRILQAALPEGVQVRSQSTVWFQLAKFRLTSSRSATTLSLQRTERTRLTRRFHGKRTSADLPSFSGLDEVKGIDATVTELAVSPEIVRRPYGRDQAVDAHFRIPDPLAVRLL